MLFPVISDVDNGDMCVCVCVFMMVVMLRCVVVMCYDNGDDGDVILKLRT